MYKKNKLDLKKFADIWSLSNRQIIQFAAYIELLEKWSERTNLISRHDIDHIVFRHLEESLYYLRGELGSVCNVADIGSGGGFPAIPLKVFHPDWNLCLIESKRIKALFLQEVVDQLSLTQTTIINARAESINLAEIDLVTARAVASLKQLWLWAHPWLVSGGCLVTLKGGEMEREEQECMSAYPGCASEVVKVQNRKLYILRNA
jgi:16S rRNA (guanine527-N7)-methyltransferase